MLRIGKRFITLDGNNYRRLMSIYGIGSRTAVCISNSLGYSKGFVLSKFDDSHYILLSIYKLFARIEYFLEIYLREANKTSLSVLSKLRSYRGIRYFRGFPIRGQRRHTNASTSRFLVTKMQKIRKRRKKRR